MDATSLQHLCLQQIAKDIKLWCGTVLDDFNEYLYMLGPFDHLGSRQIQELLTILAKKKLLKASYLHSLVHCGMTALDLSPCNYLVSDSVIQMITRRCQKLCYLALSNCKRISARVLQDLPTNLPSLRSLDLSGCFACNDTVLVSLSKHCKDLQVLKLDSCKKVTDCGITALNNNTNIVEMNLSGTSITAEGLLMLLQNHPHLQGLTLATCTTAKGEFFSDKFLSMGKTRLRYLDLSHTSINNMSIENMSTICPNISTLVLTGCSNLSSESLLHIKTLQHLKHLQLDASSIDCATELPAFLYDCGAQLETLHLPLASHINTEIIARHCHNLTNLSLADSTNVMGSLTRQGNEEITLLKACPHLKTLNLQYCNFSSLKPLKEHLSSVFCTSVNELEVLNLAGVEDLELNSVSQFLESSCFSNMRFLNISSCHLVTKELVLKIVQCCKRLQRLNVSNCWKVNRCDIEEAKQLIEKSGRPTQISWT